MHELKDNQFLRIWLEDNELFFAVVENPEIYRQADGFEFWASGKNTKNSVMKVSEYFILYAYDFPAALFYLIGALIYATNKINSQTPINS